MTYLSLARSAVAIAAALAASVTVAEDIVLHAGTLFDGIADTERRTVSVLIRDDKIISIEPGFTSPAGADVIDLSGATVLPGLIDCHVHVSALLPSRTNATEYRLTHSDIDRAFDGEEGHYLGDTEPYDVVVLDIGLPVMDGVSVLGPRRSPTPRFHCAAVR